MDYQHSKAIDLAACAKRIGMPALRLATILLCESYRKDGHLQPRMTAAEANNARRLYGKARRVLPLFPAVHRKAMEARTIPKLESSVEPMDDVQSNLEMLVKELDK